MAGLHDRFPDYFYDRNNLFSTYLGGGTLPTGRVKARTIKRSSAVGRFREPPAPRWRQRDLAWFVVANLSDDQVDVWLERVMSYHRLARSEGSPRGRVATVCDRLDALTATRYLAVLRWRKAAGRPLVTP